jgi:hypothetical protein
MYFECEQCDVVTNVMRPPYICPRCGTAVVVFCNLGEQLPQDTARPSVTKQSISVPPAPQESP